MTSQPRNPSYWKVTSEPMGNRGLDGHASADVAIVGGGIVGLTTAFMLKRSGLRVAVIESGSVGEGTTGYSSAKLTALHRLIYASVEASTDESGARAYAEANQWAIGMIAEFVETLQVDCQLERRPALTYTRDPAKADRLEAEFQAASRAGLPVTLVEDSDLPFPIARGILLEDQACFHPLRYCLGMARAVEGDGSRIFEGSRVVEIDHEQDPVRIRTAEGGTFDAAHVVLACGLPFLDREGLFARVHPSRSYCVAMVGASHLPHSMSINAGEPTYSVRPITGPEGARLLLVTGAGHQVGRGNDTEIPYAVLEDFGRREFGATAVVGRWSAQDYMSIDGRPLIGGTRTSPESVHVATGFGKWGLTLGTVAARILSDRILGATSGWAPLFDSERSQIPEGVSEAVKHGISDAKRFVGDRIRQVAAPAAQDLAPGTGGVCRHEGRAVAAFRDDQGELHLLSPTCTHLGCRVNWNVAERSWDCPCHGSRFSIRGEILNGPALEPLEPLPVEGGGGRSGGPAPGGE
jgi:glycine/D-amino acid oxidase-like deaminating enzyme/nitrite reductase/ring-hydroxylating ferredoxin subunit